MINRLVIFFISLSIVCYKVKAQTKVEMIDNILKIRSDYVNDSIPEQFKIRYIPFTYPHASHFYDTLKIILPEISFSENAFYWLEHWDWSTSRTLIIWTDSFMFRFSSKEVALKHEPQRNRIYKLEINDDFRNSQFYRDYKEWNEFVTNRSYINSFAGGGFIDCGFVFCSKFRFKNRSFGKDCEMIEIMNCAFAGYLKDDPFYYLKERREDNYIPRLQINCDWITEDRLEKVVWGLMGEHIERGHKIFDCGGIEIEFEPNSE